VKPATIAWGGRDGYKVIADTRYPILHTPEEKGYFAFAEERTGRAARRIYRATPAGVRALAAAKLKVRELLASSSRTRKVGDLRPKDHIAGGAAMRRWADLLQTRAEGWTILVRLMVGLVVFFPEGIQKFLFPEILGAGRFANIGIPYPELMGPFVGTVEVTCGVLIILGFLTRPAAVPLIIIMVTAIVSTKLPTWTGRDLWIFHVTKIARYGFWSMAHEARDDFLMLLGSLYLLIAGAGQWSVDAALAHRASAGPDGRGLRPVSEWFRLDWQYILKTGRLPGLKPAAFVLAAMPAVTDIFKIVHLGTIGFWLIWGAGIASLLALAVTQLRCPALVREYRNFNDYNKVGHAHRWIIWLFYLNRKDYNNAGAVIRETVTKGLTFRADALLTNSEFAACPIMLSPTSVVSMLAPVNLNRDLYIGIWVDGCRYVLALQENDPKIAIKTKELFWIINTNLFSSRKRSRIAIWFLYIISLALFVVALIINLAKPLGGLF